jgi:hypothetical protein
VKSVDSCNVTEPPAVDLFEDELIGSGIVRCVSMASDASDSVRSRMLLPMGANSLSVPIEVNVIDDQADISLELTNTRVSRRAALVPQSHT